MPTRWYSMHTFLFFLFYSERVIVCVSEPSMYCQACVFLKGEKYGAHEPTIYAV